jgi:enolase
VISHRPARPKTRPSPTSLWHERWQIKTAVQPSDRMGWYNQPLRIEEDPGRRRRLSGRAAFRQLDL